MFTTFALLCFHLVPLSYRNATKGEKDKESETGNNRKVAWYPLYMLAWMVEFDLIYTALWNEAFMTDASCDGEDSTGSWLSWVIAWVTWSIFLLVYLGVSTNLRSFLACTSCSCCWIVTVLVSEFLCLRCLPFRRQ